MHDFARPDEGPIEDDPLPRDPAAGPRGETDAGEGEEGAAYLCRSSQNPHPPGTGPTGAE